MNLKLLIGIFFLLFQFGLYSQPDADLSKNDHNFGIYAGYELDYYPTNNFNIGVKYKYKWLEIGGGYSYVFIGGTSINKQKAAHGLVNIDHFKIKQNCKLFSTLYYGKVNFYDSQGQKISHYNYSINCKYQKKLLSISLGVSCGLLKASYVYYQKQTPYIKESKYFNFGFRVYTSLYVLKN